MADRVIYEANKVFLHDIPGYGLNSFGSTKGYTREEIYELGSSKYKVYEDKLSQVDITIEANQVDNMNILNTLASKPVTNTSIDFANDIGSGDYVDIYAYVNPSETEMWTQYLDRAHLLSVNYNFPVDGNFTESFTLQAEGKRWYLNDGRYVAAFLMSVVPETDNKLFRLNVGVGNEIVEVLGVYMETVDGNVLVDPDDYTLAHDPSNVVEVEFDEVPTGTVFIRVACNTIDEDDLVDGSLFEEWDKSDAIPAMRRGYTKVYFMYGHTYTIGTGIVTDPGTLSQILGVQSTSVDISLDRDELIQLGNRRPYARPLVDPMNVTISIDINQRSIDEFAILADKNPASDNEFNATDARDDLGLRIELYDEDDYTRDPGVSPIRIIDVPVLIPDSDNWNINATSNASIAFGFNAHQIRVHS